MRMKLLNTYPMNLDYDEAELEGVLEERPSHTGSYDPVSLAD